MERFFTELHAHTSDTSRCGEVCAKDLVALYKAAGASTVVMTDHLSPSTFEAYKGTDLSWAEKIDIFFAGLPQCESGGRRRTDRTARHGTAV